MKVSIAILFFSVVLFSCKSSKKAETVVEAPIKVESLSVGRGQILTRKNSVVIVLSKSKTPDIADRYYVLQGATAEEAVLPTCNLSGSKDFVSLQSGQKFWVLTLSGSDRYKGFVTANADLKLSKGYGLAQYSNVGENFDSLVQAMKAGKYDSKF